MPSFFERVILFVATGAYSGYSPVAPGTAGTLVGVGIYLIVYSPNPLIYTTILLSMFFLAVLISDKAEKILLENDSRHIVIDEIFGFMVTMAFVPSSLLYIVLGFFFFRVFDILKIFPANFFDKKVKNGYGIVLDDLFAGIYANLLLQGVRFFGF
ncbi:MAG: phosphatidylglycerophosphatase A [bacterium]|nr:MAG: phosphatidylglycerophosphatase A [bacterium]